MRHPAWWRCAGAGVEVRRSSARRASWKLRSASAGLVSGKSLRACAPRLSSRCSAPDGDEAGGERHVGEHAVVARLALDVAQRCDSLASDPRHRARHPRCPSSCGAAARAWRPRSTAAAWVPRVIRFKLDGRGAAAVAVERAMSAAARAPNTIASSSELEASRLAPCRPVEATSPTAHRPGTVERRALVGGDAAHVVVGGGCHRDRLALGIDAGSAAQGVDGGKASGKCAPIAVRQSRKAPRPAAISAKTPRATMSRGLSSARGSIARHEALALALISVAPSPRNASVASGAGSAPTSIAVGMELHEFGVADDRADARRHGDRFAARIGGIGRHGDRGRRRRRSRARPRRRERTRRCRCRTRPGARGARLRRGRRRR